MLINDKTSLNDLKKKIEKKEEVKKEENIGLDDLIKTMNKKHDDNTNTETATANAETTTIHEEPEIITDTNDNLPLTPEELAIHRRTHPTLTQEELTIAKQIEQEIKEKGFLGYLNPILDKVHKGSHQSIYQALLGMYNVISGKASSFIMQTGAAESGKSYETQLALKMIPDRFIQDVDHETYANFTKAAQDHPRLYDRLIYNVGDLGSTEDLYEAKKLFDIMKRLITEGKYMYKPTDKNEDGQIITSERYIEVDSIGVVFQTTTPEYFEKDNQFKSRCMKLMPAETCEEEVLQFIRDTTGGNPKEEVNRLRREGMKELERFQYYILYTLTKPCEYITSHWDSTFSDYVQLSSTKKRDTIQAVRNCQAYAQITFHECDEGPEPGMKHVSKKQITDFFHGIMPVNGINPLFIELIRLLKRKRAEKPTRIVEDEEDLNSYFYDTLEYMYPGEIVEQDKLEDMDDFQIKRFIKHLMNLYRLKNPGSKKRRACVFFTVTDLKIVMERSPRVASLRDNASLFLFSLEKEGLVEKLDYKHEGKNVYYLTSLCHDCEEIVTIKGKESS